MSKRIGKWLGIGIALVLVLGIGGAVLAQGPLPPQGDESGQPFFGGRWARRAGQMFCGRQPQMLARGLGMDVEDVHAALGDAVSELAASQGMTLDEVAENILAPAIERLQQAVDNGRITQEEADEIIARMKARLVEGMENGTWFSWGARQLPQRRGLPNLSVLSETLNMTDEELREALADGKTVAEIAEEQGVALDDVVDALIAPAVERIQQRVEDGTLTQEEADEHIAEMRSHIQEMLENGMPSHPRPPFPGGAPGTHGWAPPSGGPGMPPVGGPGPGMGWPH